MKSMSIFMEYGLTDRVKDHFSRNKGKYALGLGALVGYGLAKPETIKPAIGKIGQKIETTGQKIETTGKKIQGYVTS
jgi:hypothetical protein